MALIEKMEDILLFKSENMEDKILSDVKNVVESIDNKLGCLLFFYFHITPQELENNGIELIRNSNYGVNFNEYYLNEAISDIGDQLKKIRGNIDEKIYLLAEDYFHFYTIMIGRLFTPIILENKNPNAEEIVKTFNGFVELHTYIVTYYKIEAMCCIDKPLPIHLLIKILKNKIYQLLYEDRKVSQNKEGKQFTVTVQGDQKAPIILSDGSVETTDQKSVFGDSNSKSKVDQKPGLLSKIIGWFKTIF